MNHWTKRALFALLSILLCFLLGLIYWRWVAKETDERVKESNTHYELSTTGALSDAEQPILHALNNEITKTLDCTSKSIVSINTSGVLDIREVMPNTGLLINRRLTVQGLGSGVIVTPQGHIITNYHVVQGKQSIRVTLHDGRSLPVYKIGEDPTLDIAVLKIDHDEEFDPIPFGNSDHVTMGEIVFACGNPYGLGISSSQGIISAKQRRFAQTNTELIQSDAPVFPGNSGGPMINIRGEIIGITTARLLASDNNSMPNQLSFAIPANLVIDAFKEICAHGRVLRSYTGLNIVDISEEIMSYLQLNANQGALVNFILEGSPAQVAGLKIGDLIQSVNGTKVNSSLDLTNKLNALKAGQIAKLAVLRKGEQMNLDLTIEDLFEAEKNYNKLRSQGYFEKIGIDMRELSLEERALGVQGILIERVLPNSPGSKLFQSGDLIIGVNNMALGSITALMNAVKNQLLTLTVKRDKQILEIQIAQ